MQRPGRGSLWAILAVFAIDRLHKFIQIHVMGWTGGEAVRVNPYFDYVLVWNTGISYGLFGGLPAWTLVGVMLVAALALAIWWWRTDSAMTRWGLAIALGGALGNIIDRLAYGAVADFFSLHAGGFYFYIFNIADMAITVGIVILVIEMLLPAVRRRPS